MQHCELHRYQLTSPRVTLSTGEPLARPLASGHSEVSESNNPKQPPTEVSMRTLVHSSRTFQERLQRKQHATKPAETPQTWRQAYSSRTEAVVLRPTRSLPSGRKTGSVRSNPTPKPEATPSPATP